MSEADIARTFATIRDMGANTIRLTHYQHGETIHTLADRYGLVLWDEIPLVTQWTQGEAINPTTALVGNAQQQLAELIRQNFNHPAVAFWGVANEVDFGPIARISWASHPRRLPIPRRWSVCSTSRHARTTLRDRRSWRRAARVIRLPPTSSA
jgi:beta-galactosidase/beta-glucuronidase